MGVKHKMQEQKPNCVKCGLVRNVQDEPTDYARLAGELIFLAGCGAGNHCTDREIPLRISNRKESQKTIGEKLNAMVEEVK